MGREFTCTNKIEKVYIRLASAEKLNLILCFVIKTEILPIIIGFIANAKDQKPQSSG